MVPLLFIVVYLSRIIPFQVDNEYKDTYDIFLKMLGFISGTSVVIAITIIYFSLSNKDIIHFGSKHANHPTTKFSSFHLKNDQPKTEEEKEERIKWRVDTYLSGFNQIRLVRGTEHYDSHTLAKVFRQNHRNAFMFELGAMLLVFSVGLFSSFPFFRIPAGASIMLILSALIMFSSGMRYWLKGWTIPLLIVMLIGFINITSLKLLERKNYAYGLDYHKHTSDYSIANIDYLQHKYNDIDIQSTLAILNKWKDRNTIDTTKKPKMIFIDVSGGGSRSALWTFHVLAMADSILGGSLMKNTFLITGASGGMIGASYYRELYQRHYFTPSNTLQRIYYESKISKDLLNPIAFSIVVNDLLVRVEKFKDGNYEYYKDRAYAFENQLNENTDFMLNNRLGDYRIAEANAQIPMMIFAPTVEEDGRKLYISSQSVSYLINTNLHNRLTFLPLPDGAEYSRLLANNNPMNIRFTSVIRMSATFPYILPNVALPTNPQVEVMDAGIRDNFGVKTSIKFLYVFRDWIAENTSGVIFLQVRDTYKQSPLKESGGKGILHDIFTPIGTVYSNFMKTQDYNVDGEMQVASSWFGGKMDWLIFQLPFSKAEVSLNWHLTTKEKNIIIQSANHTENETTFKRLKYLMEK